MPTRVINIKAARPGKHAYIGRGNGGRAHMLNTPIGQRGWLGNPFPLSDYSREESCNRFREAFLDRIDSDLEFREAVLALKGQTLGCYCHPLQCHGDTIAEYLDSLPEPKSKKGRK